MLSVHKNSVLSSVTLEQAAVRQKELDFYTNNYWIWGGTTVIMAGFALAELTREIPQGTHPALECAYLGFTSICLSLDLCIVTWTVLVCTWGPGNALRGPDGMKSFHETIALLKEEQMPIYYAFVVSIVAYFGSSCCLLWVYPSDFVPNAAGTCVLILSFTVLVYMQCVLEQEVGVLGNSHDDDGRIKTFTALDDVADLDMCLSDQPGGT